MVWEQKEQTCDSVFSMCKQTRQESRSLMGATWMRMFVGSWMLTVLGIVLLCVSMEGGFIVSLLALNVHVRRNALLWACARRVYVNSALERGGRIRNRLVRALTWFTSIALAGVLVQLAIAVFF